MIQYSASIAKNERNTQVLAVQNKFVLKITSEKKNHH